MKLSHTISLLWTTASLVGLVTANEDCNPGEKQLEFTFFLDEDSLTENGWTLECDGEGLIWNVPVGTLQANTAVENPFVKEQVCLPENFTCHFTLEDLYGDGLLFPGYYYLTFGAETIAVSEDEEEFFEKSYCLGPNCPVHPFEETEDCDNIYIFFQADESPEESSISIECGGETIYSKSDFMTAQETIEVEKCVPLDTCCILTIKDSASNGLQPSQGGSIFVEWANQVVFEYDDTDPFEFDVISTNFGMTCPALDYGGDEQDEEAEMNEEPDADETVAAQEDEESESTTGDNIEQEIMDAPPSMPSAATIAISVLASLLGLGLVAWVVHRFNSSKASSGPPVKDIEFHSTGSGETAAEEEI